MLERVWRKGYPLRLLVGCKLVQPLWITVWRFLKKLEIELPYDPAIPLLGTHTEETRIERDTCIPMFIAALFTIARIWKQPRCPWAEKWIRKLWYIYTMEYYLAIKKNAFESVLMRWVKLEPITQSEVSQKEKHQYSIQFSSVAQSCPTLCNPMNCSTPGLPFHCQLPEFTQTHVHWVGDAMQPSHPLSSPSPPAFNLSQHQGLFQWISSSH